MSLFSSSDNSTNKESGIESSISEHASDGPKTDEEVVLNEAEEDTTNSHEDKCEEEAKGKGNLCESGNDPAEDKTLERARHTIDNPVKNTVIDMFDKDYKETAQRIVSDSTENKDQSK